MTPAHEEAIPGSQTRPRPDVLAGLFPPTVTGSWAAVSDTHLCPYAQERALVAAAAARRRRRDFAAGRACAHAALAQLGQPSGPIGRGPGGQPRWPSGVVGSISHGGDLAAAVAALDVHVEGLGLDIEPLEPGVDEAVDRLVRTTAERRNVAADPPWACHLATIVFCAKECVYKAVFPATGWPLSFHDVHVDVDLDRSRFTARIDRRFRHASGPPTRLDGTFAVVAGHLVAGLAWRTP